MLKIKEAIIVEGRYDKIKLSQLFDTAIIETGGFSIFNNLALREYIASVASTAGIVILTDSDGAGFVIRNYIKSFVNNTYIKNAYIPDEYGKEKRKNKPGKENKIGVEGIDDETITKAVLNSGVTVLDLNSTSKSYSELTKYDMYRLGISGGESSGKKRSAIIKYFNLPERMSSNELLDALNMITSKSELEQICQALGMFDNV